MIHGRSEAGMRAQGVAPSGDRSASAGSVEVGHLDGDQDSLRRALEAACAGCRRTVVVDCDGVTHLDPGGVQAIGDARIRLGTDGRSLELRHVGQGVRRGLRATGAPHLLEPLGADSTICARLCEVHVRRSAAGALVSLTGQLCYASSPGVGDRLIGLLHEGPMRRLDMRGLAFFDLSALDMLRRVLRASGTPEAILILPGTRARRLIDIVMRGDDRPDVGRGPEALLASVLGNPSSGSRPERTALAPDATDPGGQPRPQPPAPPTEREEATPEPNPGDLDPDSTD
jgi:anti-anti-sigma regulatory factor